MIPSNSFICMLTPDNLSPLGRGYLGEHAIEGFYGWVTIGNFFKFPFSFPKQISPG